MRPVCYSAAMSLDGYIAGPRGEFDWIPMDPEIDFGALFARYDCVLLGRKSWEAARRQDPIRHAALGLRPGDCPGATLSSDPRGTVEALKRQPGKAIWLFGGGVLFRSLLELGLVDEVQVAVVPVLLGEGLPFLEHPTRLAKLRLTRHRVYEKTGTALLEYAVAGRS